MVVRKETEVVVHLSFVERYYKIIVSEFFVKIGKEQINHRKHLMDNSAPGKRTST